MKKIIISLVVVLLFSFVFVTGCESNKEEKTDTTADSSGKIEDVDDLNSKSGTLLCTRNAVVDGGEGEFNYTIKYKNGILLNISSLEKVKSDDSSVLQEYEDAYKKIDDYYVGIDHYVAKVVRDDNSVTHTIDIDYERINIQELIDLEGEEDNIFENKKPMLKKYLELAKKTGVTCSESTV